MIDQAPFGRIQRRHDFAAAAAAAQMRGRAEAFGDVEDIVTRAHISGPLLTVYRWSSSRHIGQKAGT
jgi:hypothetical protein